MVDNTFKNIMVPFDDSKFARNALEIAKILAKLFDSTLHIVTVIDISNVASPGLIRSEDRKSFEQMRASLIQSVRKTINQKGDECMQEKIKAKGSILEGSIANELLKFIKENHIDLAIIGSQGLSGLSRLKALGSVSRKISELSDCPVMIIR